MKTQAQPNPAPAVTGTVVQRQDPVAVTTATAPQGDDEEYWAPKSGFLKVIWPVVGNWPFTCLWVSTAFLSVCYIFGGFKHRTFDETWNPALNPARLFQRTEAKTKAVQVAPVQATLRANQGSAR